MTSGDNPYAAHFYPLDADDWPSMSGENRLPSGSDAITADHISGTVTLALPASEQALSPELVAAGQLLAAAERPQFYHDLWYRLYSDISTISVYDPNPTATRSAIIYDTKRQFIGVAGEWVSTNLMERSIAIYMLAGAQTSAPSVNYFIKNMMLQWAPKPNSRVLSDVQGQALNDFAAKLDEAREENPGYEQQDAAIHELLQAEDEQWREPRVSRIARLAFKAFCTGAIIENPDLSAAYLAECMELLRPMHDEAA